jgi:hypothetical protein
LPPAHNVTNAFAVVATHFENLQTFDAVKAGLLKAAPDDKELSPMLKVLGAKATELGDWNKIQQHVNNGNYPESKKILDRIPLQQKQAAWDAKVEKWLLQPHLPDKRSFLQKACDQILNKRHEI